jgi:hypothetical protein
MDAPVRRFRKAASENTSRRSMVKVRRIGIAGRIAIDGKPFV